METKDSSKRFKRLFLIGMIAVLLIVQGAKRFANQVPYPQRGLWFLGILVLVMLPYGYVYGRNSARADSLGRISRGLAYGAAACLLVGVILGGWLKMLAGIGAGYLIGFAVGRVAYRKSVEKYGDSIEADQYLNIVRSERAPKAELPYVAYLKSRDEPTRKVIGRLGLVEPLGVFAGIGFAVWIVVADCLDPLSRFLFVHPGDGTRYFITLDPIVVTVPLILIFIAVAGVIWDRILRIIAGPRADTWQEFSKLRTSANSTKHMRGLSIFVCAILSASVLAHLMFFDCYLKVTDQGIAINRFLGLGARFYCWSDVRDVKVGQEDYVCKNGHTHQRLRIRVCFTDGSEWKPDTSFGRRTPEIERAARYIAARTGH